MHPHRYSYRRLIVLLVYLSLLLYGLTDCEQVLTKGIVLLACAFVLLNIYDCLCGEGRSSDNERADHND